MPNDQYSQGQEGGPAGGLALDELQDERQRAERFVQWFKQSHDAFSRWRDKAIESYKFVSGDQWSDADKQVRTEQKRPCLVINKVLGPVLFLGGVQRQQRQEPKFIPFESDDVRSAELIGALYKWVGMRCREPVVDSQVFLDKITCGLGFWKIRLDYEQSDAPEGDIVWERLSPLSVFPDPQWLDAGWKSAQYVTQATWMTQDEAVAQWPEREEEIKRQFGEWLGQSIQGGGVFGGGSYAGDSLADQRLFWDKETQRVRILEVWYARKVPVEIQVEGVSQRRFVKRVFLAHCLNRILLDDGPSPYQAQDFPIFPTVGYYFWKEPFGIIEPMKDPQREKNVRRSTLVDMVRRSALSGFFNKKGLGAKTDDLERFAAGTSVVINYESEMPQQLRPPDLPQTLVFLDARADQEIRDVVNIHNELLGNTSQRTVSGRAIEARQRSGLTVQEPLLESFEQDKEPAVRFMVSLIQQFVSPARAMRVLGTIVRREPTTPVAAMMSQMGEMELLQALSQAFTVEYDVVIDSRSFEPSVNQHRWNTLMELSQAFPGQIPPDVLISAAMDTGLISKADAEQIRQRVAMNEQMAQMTAASAMASGTVPPSGTVTQ